MRILMIVIVVLLAMPALAQPPTPPPEPPTTPPAQEPPRLPPVVVEGAKIPPDRTRTDEEAREELSRVPGGTAVIDRTTIDDTRAANLKDVLDFVPGVMIRPRFGAADESQLSIRGSGLRNNFHLRGINVLLDGFIYGQADGFSDFESLELLFTKRIEVYKGANALALGGYTLGGAINLVEKTGYDAGLVELRSEAGSFGFFKGYIGTGQVYGPFDVYAAFADTELDGYREHSEQVRRRAFVTLGYALPGGTTLRLDLGYTRNEEELPGALTMQEFKSDPRQQDPTVKQFRQARNYDYVRGGFTLRTPLGADQALEWKTQLDYQDLDHPLSFAVIDQTTYNVGTEARYVLAAPLFGHGNRFTLGVQFFTTHQNDVQFQNLAGQRGAEIKDQVNLATNVGAYAEDQFDVTPSFTAVLGGRLQYALREVRDQFLSNGNQSDDVDYLSFVPKIGFVWRVGPTVQIFANASKSYEPPLLLELTAPGQIGGDLRELKPQKAWQFEVGTRGTFAKRVGWDVSLYDIELWDEILNVNVRPFPFAPFTIPRFINIDRSRHQGVEAGGDVVLVRDVAPAMGLGSIGDALSARVAYTFSRFVFVNDETFGNNDLPGAPSHFIRAELRYDHNSGFWIAPNMEWVPTGYFVDSANTVRTPAYALGNVRMGFDHRPTNISVFFEARNLANTNYVSSVVVDSANARYFEPGDGRAFYGGVSWRFR
jgi:iron complex outermembrane receptor protein